jgi:hypothetical protein
MGLVQVYCLGAGEVSTLLKWYATQILREDGPDLSSMRTDEVHNDSTCQWSGHIRRQRRLLEEWQQHQAHHNDASKSLVFFPASLSRQPPSLLCTTGPKPKADDGYRAPRRRPCGRECFWKIITVSKESSEYCISIPARPPAGCHCRCPSASRARARTCVYFSPSRGGQHDSERGRPLSRTSSQPSHSRTCARIPRMRSWQYQRSLMTRHR